MRAAFIFARNRTAAGRHGELLAEGTCARPDRPIGPDEPEVLELFVVSRNVHASYDMTTVFQTMFACSQRQGCVFEIPASVYGSGPVVSIQQRRDEAGHLDVAFEGFGMLHIYYPPELNRTCPCENHTFQPSSGIRDILGHVGPVVGGHEGGSPKPDNPSPKP
jgi:hypothetical protein